VDAPTSQPLGELSPSDIISRMAAAQRRKQDADDEIAACKQILGEMRDKGLIGDKAEADGYTVTLQVRESWTYSQELKTAQDMERAEGIATKKTSTSWFLRQNKSQVYF